MIYLSLIVYRAFPPKRHFTYLIVLDGNVTTKDDEKKKLIEHCYLCNTT